jgi:hypothetical protein
LRQQLKPLGDSGLSQDRVGRESGNHGNRHADIFLSDRGKSNLMASLSLPDKSATVLPQYIGQLRVKPGAHDSESHTGRTRLFKEFSCGAGRSFLNKRNSHIVNVAGVFVFNEYFRRNKPDAFNQTIVSVRLRCDWQFITKTDPDTLFMDNVDGKFAHDSLHANELIIALDRPAAMCKWRRVASEDTFLDSRLRGNDGESAHFFPP